MRKRLANLKLCVIGLVFATTLVSQAQKKPGYIPPSIDDNEEIPVVKTDLPVPEEGEDYVVKYFKGITDGEESRIAVKNLGYIIRPSMVQVISEDGRELSIELVKKNWDDVVRSGNTKDGKFESSFKTALEFGIKINAKEKGIPFIVAVSAGIELFPPNNLFVDAGTKRLSPEKDESEIIDVESGKSNNTLYIIIACALIGILVLLAIIVFKKKSKGSATILLLMITLPIHANVVRAVSGSAVGVMTRGIGKGLAEHYGKGGFNNDNPLTEDDKNYEPDLDPRGRPSLPSSCYEIARMGGSGGTGDNVGKGRSFEAKNPTSADGGTTISSGEVAGAISGGETGADVGHENGKDRDFELERTKLNDNHSRDMALSAEVYNRGLQEARNNFSLNIEESTNQMQRDILNANENTELINQAVRRHTKTLSELHGTLTTNSDQLARDWATTNAKLVLLFGRDLQALIEESLQQNNAGVEKDPDSQQTKGGGDAGKGVDSPDDSEGQSSNSRPRERNREQEAGCKCLEEAYAILQKQRYSLEKLLKIGQHTKKVTDFGISFGDSFAGIHGVSGLAWQKQRAKVLKSIDNFDVTYTNKYNELIEALYNALIQIDECENKLGYENWYSQSGFIYYEFMKVRYASYK